jgi:pimeloyl-ACP methyl ester carboxylesterase
MNQPIQNANIFVQVGEEPLRTAYLYRPGQGRPMVLLHGMGSSRKAFLPLLETFPVENPVYAMDLPGFGASQLPRRRQGLEDFVAAVVAFCEALSLQQPVLVGHSFGGMVAAETAINHPGLLAGVLLVASAGWVSPQHVMQPTRFVWVNRVGIWLTGSDWFGKKMVAALGMDPRQLTAADRARMRYGWRHAREMARMGRFYETEAMAYRLAASGVPALVLAGSRDPLFPLAEVEGAIRGQLPLEVWEGVGHIPIDQDLPGFRERLVAALSRFHLANRQQREGQ